MDVPIKEEEPSTADEASSNVVSHGKPLPFAWDSCSKELFRSRVSIKQQAVDDAYRHAKFIRQAISTVWDDEGSEAFKELFDENIVAWMDETHKSNHIAWKPQKLTDTNSPTRKSS